MRRNGFALPLTVAVMTDWGEGVGFGINEVVWTNKTKTSTEDQEEGTGE